MPEYLRKLLEWKKQYMENQRLKAIKASRERVEREYYKREAKMGPPVKAWRIGRMLLWEPSKFTPAGYWIQEERNGSWTNHGDYLPNHSREAILYGDGHGRIEAFYHNRKLNAKEHVTEILEAIPGEPSMLVQTARFYASQTNKGREHIDRWRRVLAAFGVTESKVGWAGRPPVSPLNPPITYKEAKEYAEMGWKDWDHVASVIARLQGIKEETKVIKLLFDHLSQAERNGLIAHCITIRDRHRWVPGHIKKWNNMIKTINGEPGGLCLEDIRVRAVDRRAKNWLPIWNALRLEDKER